MRSIHALVMMLLLSLFGPAAASEQLRAGCDSCRINVNSLDEPIKLSGKWLFTRDDELKNKDVVLDTSAWPLIKTPGPWKGAYPDKTNFKVGWYRGVLEFDPSLVGQEVVFLLNTYAGRVTVYNNGDEIYTRPGDINVDRYYSNQAIPVRFKVKQPQHVLAIRVDTLLMTGVYQLPFELKKYDKHDTSLAWGQFISGEARILAGFVVFFFGLFFLLIYKKTKYPLYLLAAISSIIVFPFFVAPSDFMMRVMSPEPLILVHYIGLYVFFPAYLFTQFFYKFTPRFNWIAGSIFLLVGLVIAAQLLNFNINAFQSARSVFFLMGLMFGILSMYQAIRGSLLNRAGARILFVGMLTFFIGGVHDMLMAFGVITSTSAMFFAVLGFVTSMLLVSSNIFANTFVENKRMAHDLKIMNENLEQLVAQRTMQLREKTNDILTMLQNMPQGILTVTNGAVIHPEYSAYLEQIFETKDIAGKNIMDLVFSHTNLGSDTLSQVQAVPGACIGEDRMNFEFNSHLMVTELDKTMPSGRVKSLELSWSPICDDQDVCDKLMLCVRDVTELKGLAAQADSQRRELEMIGEILAVNQEKFHQFIDSSEQFVEENREVIEKMDGKNADAIALLFRNMHTIKGNARTYGLLQLTNTVHETEQTYDNLRKNPETEWNKALLLDQLKETAQQIGVYAKVNEVKLGRRGPGRRGGVDKFLMVQKGQIESLISELEKGDSDQSAGGGAREVFQRALNSLRQIGTEKFGDVLAGVIDSLPSLAKELGKEAPNFRLYDNQIVVRAQIADLLKNVFMHLLRNSVDHGIESAEKRMSSGKEPVGNIYLDVSMSDGKLLMRLRDDGKGLALAVLRRKAVESGIIEENQNTTAEEIAQLIFASGFSTAAAVTEVSGRGVGMDAVKGFVEREGGAIELRFVADDVGSEFRQFETVISLPEKFGLRVSNIV